MKKIKLLQCYDVTDAVQDGIEDFNRLSGYSPKIKLKIIPIKKPIVKNVFNFISLTIITLLAKIIK